MHSFDIDGFLFRFRYPLIFFLLGLILIGGGIIYLRTGFKFSGTRVEVLDETIATESGKLITVEISGSVEKPGVYKLVDSSRIDDLLITAGGFSTGADREWTDKYLNRAARLTDGQKIFIPQHSSEATAKENGIDQSVSPTFSSDSKVLININNASLGQLDALPGIGQVYGQNIIEHRPYSTVEELLSKGALKKSVYEKVKELVSVY